MVSKKPQTANDWLKNAPPAIRSAVTNAMQVEREERHRLIRLLTANVSDEGKKRQVVARLLKKDLAELKDLVSLMPTGNSGAETDELTMFFQGGGGGPNGGQGGSFGGLTDNEAEDVLDIDSARDDYDPLVIRNRQRAERAG